MTATTPALRLFILKKAALKISLSELTSDGATLYHWEVRYGPQSISTGVAENATSIPEALKRVADDTVTRSPSGDMAVRSLTWQALDNHEHVPARELRAGDCLHVCAAVYRVVKAVAFDGDGVQVTFGHQDGQPFTRRYPLHQLCNLIERGPQA